MDVKPQRPLRSIRVRNDENLPPEGQPAKTIHQRNKSSPALTGGPVLKAAAKRTAFGDVSNIVAGIKPSKDDSILPVKSGLLPTGKAALCERKSTALLRPAQRPTSLSGLKTYFTGGTSNNAVTDSIPKPLPVDTGSHPQNTHTRKTLTKRNTSVFKDKPLDAVQETALPGYSVDTFDEKETVQNAVQLATESQPSLPHPASSHQAVDPTKQDRGLGSDISLPGIDEVDLGPQLSSQSFNVEEVKVNTLAAPDASRQPAATETNTGHVLHKDILIVSELNAAGIKPYDTNQMSLVNLVNPIDVIPPLPPSSTYEPRQDQTEYWGEEDENEYEEEGYVTARSFRSRGESTTGAATTILFPQVNARARKEIAAAKQLVEATRLPEDIEDESYDTSMVAEYGDEIFDYMRQLEMKMLPNAHYMDNQHEIQWSMRSVLMDWLVQVHHRFNLLPETLFLCVNYIDRFLSCKVVSLGKLQLVGATAIFIAAKYEEINCPSVQEIVYMVDGGYTVDEILKAERFMLTMLQFELGWPGPMSFLRRISKADDYDLETRTLAKYFLEMTLMDERFIGSPPSFAAAASHCLARLMLRKGSWTPHHVYYSGYTFSQLRPIVSLLLECCEDPRKHHAAVYNKYCDKRYKRASAFVETEMQRGFELPNPVALPPLLQPATGGFYDSVSFLQT